MVSSKTPSETRTSSVATRNSSSGNGEMGLNRTSQGRLEVRREFLKTTTKGTQDEAFTNPETLPSIEAAYNTFQRIYPKYAETWVVDDLRDREYFHLEENRHVCMDYCGFGLFSYYQQIINKASSSFGLAYISANLPTHALYGAADEGTAEFYIRKRVFDYLNINDTEYSMVFTASRGSACKLLAESYPFHLNPKLLTVYDFESEAVNWMAQCAKQKGAKILSACFKWPSLRIGTSHLKKLLQEKKKKGESAKGLFVFPVQSRMTGAKYSYQWMSEAQQNKWHVLLDASSLGPKDMDSLGLSLFRPDFIVSSFYKVFGTDPTGFGCLFIKNTAIHSLHNSSRARAVGMVRIVSLFDCPADGPEVKESEDDGEKNLYKRSWGLGEHNGHSISSFSGPFFTAAEAEVKTKQLAKESNHRAWKSWKRSSKMVRHDRDYCLHSTGSGDLTETVSGIGEGAGREVESVAQPPESRYYLEARATEIEEEQPNRATDILHGRDIARRLYERSENDIQELGDDQVGEGNSRELNNPKWSSNGRVTGTQKEHKSVEFHSLGGKGISAIREEDMEDDHEVEERWQNERCTKASGTGNESGGAHMLFSQGRRDRGANEIEKDAVDLGRNCVGVLAQFDAEAVEGVVGRKCDSSAVDDSQPGRRLDLKDRESNMIARRHQHAINEVSNVEELGESSDFLAIGEHFDDFVEQNALRETVSDAGNHSSVQARLHSFERRASFKRQTGKQLSDFQEMGVQGLVQKFQNLQSEDASDEEFQEAVDEDLPLDEESQPSQTEDQSPGTSPRSLTRTQNVAEVAAKENYSQYENSRQFDVGFEAVSSYLSTAFNNPAENALEVRGTVAEDYPGRATSETSSRRLGAGGNFKQSVDIAASATEGDSNSREEGDPSFLETLAEATSESSRPDDVHPSRNILVPGNVGETTIIQDPGFQQRSAFVLKRGGQSAEELELDLLSCEYWSQDEESSKEQSLKDFPRSSSVKGNLSPPHIEGESRVWDCKHAVNSGEWEESPVDPFPARIASSSLSQTDVRASDSPFLTDEHNTAEKGAVSWDGETGRPTEADFKPGTAPVDRLREVCLGDEFDRSADLKREHLPCRDSAVHGLQRSSSFRGHGRTPYESGEENYITILPSRNVKNWSKSVTETWIGTRTSGSQELSDKETTSASDRGQREYMPIMDDPLSPEKSLIADHAREEVRLFNLSKSSPSIEFDKNLSSIVTPLYQVETPNHHSKEGSSADDITFDIKDSHDAKVQDLRDGRFDLRNNRTLSRNVDFKDELGRPSYVSELLTSRSQSTPLAEDIARQDMQDSDEEPSFHLQYCSGLLHGYNPSRYLVDDVQPASYEESEDGETEDEYEDLPEAELPQGNGEPMISCKGLDFADSLGLTKLNYRLRYLINWLVNSLLKLRHPGPNQGIPLVRIYGPKVKYDRGAAVSFNVFDWKGVLIHPGLVQRLADRSNISLGVGRLCNIVDPEMSSDFMAEKERFFGVDKIDKSWADYSSHAGKVEIGKSGSAGDSLSIPVVTAAMGFVSSFEDVYKLWSFLAKFLDADYVSKEVWRYHSLNQQIMIM